MLTNKEVQDRLISIYEQENKYTSFYPLIMIGGPFVLTGMAIASAVLFSAVEGTLGIILSFITLGIIIAGGIAACVKGSLAIENAGKRRGQVGRGKLIEDLSIFAENTYSIEIPEASRIDISQDITTPFLTRSATGEVIKAEFALFEDNWVLLVNGKEATRINSTVSQEV